MTQLSAKEKKMAEYGIQISAKDHLGRITVISGKDAESFKSTLGTIVGSEDAEHILNAMALALVGSEAVAATAPLYPKSNQDNVQSGGLTDIAADGPAVMQDKYGNTWTYGLPNSPVTTNGRGAFALKSWVDKTGKPRKKWFDPAAGPAWSGGPVNKDSLEEGPWYKG
jgi:hypothetical protein